MGVVFRRMDKKSFGYLRTFSDHMKEGRVFLVIFSHGHIYLDLKFEDWIYFLGYHYGIGQDCVLYNTFVLTRF